MAATPDVTELYRRAVTTFSAHVEATGDEQWTLPTPCEDWDVRALVNHVTAEDLWTPPLFEGRTIAEVGDRFDGDVLGQDPRAAATAAADAALAAVMAPGSLQRTVHLSSGDDSGESYAWQLFADHLIHAWDLARGIGADERMDPESVAACSRWFAAHEAGWRAAGLIAERPPLAPDADEQTALLAMFGRSA